MNGDEGWPAHFVLLGDALPPAEPVPALIDSEVSVCQLARALAAAGLALRYDLGRGALVIEPQ